MPALTVEALAKVNLSLAVMERRADGLHELAGVMALIELGDTLTLTSGAPGLRVSADAAAEVPTSRSQNLAWRGLVAGAGGEPEMTCLTLEKRIPVGAGLGGGSSDAAAAWWLGRRLTGRGESPTGEVLARELAPIGADVPFFAAQTPAAYVTGIGETVRPLPARGAGLVLALPDFPLSTAAVFAELRPSDWSRERPEPTVGPGRNDLLAAALRLRPELRHVFAAIERGGGEPHLSGSGSACFTMTDDPERAGAVASSLRAGGVRTMVTRLAVAAPAVEELPEDEGMEA